MTVCFSFKDHLTNPTPSPETMLNSTNYFYYTGSTLKEGGGREVGEGTLIVCAYRVCVACVGKHRKCEFIPTHLSLIVIHSLARHTSLIAQCLKHPIGVRRVTGSIPVWDSNVFLCPTLVT